MADSMRPIRSSFAAILAVVLVSEVLLLSDPIELLESFRTNMLPKEGRRPLRLEERRLNFFM